ncbi:MAG: hydantoinase B/oxoprolinase family protein [Streptosporangiales bacterium]|nr:hydantoinase B/oxoprolinase family protein [Streptosporangiales bacterium]
MMAVPSSGRATAQLEVQVLWNRIETLVEEQARALIHTAFSNILSEGADLSAAVFDTSGNMIGQAVTGTPGHINVTGVAVRNFLRKYPAGSLRPGDVLISNDPYGISGHLLDIAVVTPVFMGDDAVAYVASICHTVDIGGIGYTLAANSTFEEGLYLPYLKLYKAGRPNEDVHEIIAANVRAPDQVLGDLRAQVAGNSVAARGLLELMEEFGLSEVDSFSADITARTERAIRSAIEKVPDGTYTNELMMDGAEKDIRLCASVRVEGGAVTVDFEGSSSASELGLNVCYNYTAAYTIFAVKAALAPDVPNNEGTFRPVTVVAPRGSIVHAIHPQPTQARHVVGQAVAEVVLGALAKAVPEDVICEGATPLWILSASGQRPDGSPFSFTFFTSGGMGATAKGDGLSATMFPSGARGTPVEIVEASSPLLFLRKELRADSGGAGQYRGGCGQVISFRARTGLPWRLPTMYGRTAFPAQGLRGGAAGARGSATRNDTETLEPMNSYVMAPDDVVTLLLPGGGGYGEPGARERDAISEDVANGYVSGACARDDYGFAEDGSQP